MSEHNSPADASVLFEAITCANDKQIGVVTLNVEKTLNSLTLEMVELMLDQFERWKSDDSLVCIFIKGAGGKALCAGGDVQALYQSATEQPGGPCGYAETFFAKEYQLDYLIHSYPKPIICWGHGIVMGGGLGVFAACSHRIVTEKTRLAMPEVTIALYPDVGGSWFLNKMPGNIGEFLALTGAPINGADSLFIGIADHFISSPRRDELLDNLCNQNWSASTDENHHLLNQCLTSLSAECEGDLPVSNVEQNQQIINELCAFDDIRKIVSAISSLESDDKWLSRAKNTLMAGSPLSVLIIHQQLAHSRDLSLADVFRSELLLSTNIVRYPEFAEGVRALLIDKDNNPRWQYSSVDVIPEDVVERFFTAPETPAPWPRNPLENL